MCRWWFCFCKLMNGWWWTKRRKKSHGYENKYWKFLRGFQTDRNLHILEKYRKFFKEISIVFMYILRIFSEPLINGKRKRKELRHEIFLVSRFSSREKPKPVSSSLEICAESSGFANCPQSNFNPRAENKKKSSHTSDFDIG